MIKIINIFLRPDNNFYNYYNNYISKDPINCETDKIILDLFKIKHKLYAFKKSKNHIKNTKYKCPICLDTYSRSKLLISKCNHICCIRCFFSLIDKNETLSCHICRSENNRNSYEHFLNINDASFELKYLKNYSEILISKIGIKIIEIIKYLNKYTKRFINKTNILIVDSKEIENVFNSSYILKKFKFIIILKDKKYNIHNINNINIFNINNNFNYTLNYSSILNCNLNLINHTIYNFIIKNTIDEKIFNKEVVLF